MMMRNIGKNRYTLFCLLLISLLTACSTEDTDYIKADGNNTCRLIWDANIVDFGGGTRATIREKKDGDCVFLRFKSGNDYVDGKAVYQQSVDEWILTYDGSLAVGETSTCDAYYIDNVPDGTPQIIDLTTQTLVCSDLNAEYTRGSNYVKLSAYLTPSMSRIRFKGEEGKTFLLSGIKYYTSFNENSLEFKTSQTPLELTVGADGFTEYVHALPLADRTLTIYYDYQTFKTSCNSPILDAGRSGYMTLPTESAHNGWNLVKVELPTVSSVTMGVISDVTAEVNASVVSLGNGTLLDAGFVYSATPKPTIESNKVSCGAVEKLNTQLSNLTPITTYYVRAYVINERGISYSEQKTFTTTAAPTLPKVMTGTATNVTTRTATISGSVDDFGNTSMITQHGHVWSTSPHPTINSNKTTLGKMTSLDSFSSQLTGLTHSTKYYVRAYATNSVGTAYGEEIVFTTPEGGVKLETSRVSKISYNTATVSGKVIQLDGHIVSEIGVCWATTESPTIKDNKQRYSSSATSCSVEISGLKEKTHYYIRVYVKIETGEYYYGNVIDFYTTSEANDVSKDYYGEDDEWSNNDNSNTSVGRNDFGEDEDWSRDIRSSANDVNKNNYGEDEDLSSNDNSNTGVERNDFKEDEDWSRDSQNTNNVITK